MAGLYPLSRMQQFDGNGRPLSGARLFLFDGGTSTPRIGYRDSSLTSPHPNPILADSAGRLPLIYLDDGFYRHRLTTRTGALVFDDDGLPVLSTTTGGSGTSVDPDSDLQDARRQDPLRRPAARRLCAAERADDRLGHIRRDRARECRHAEPLRRALAVRQHRRDGRQGRQRCCRLRREQAAGAAECGRARALRHG